MNRDDKRAPRPAVALARRPSECGCGRDRKGKGPPPRAGMRGQAPLSIGRTDNAEIGTEPMGEAPRAGFEPARGNPAVFETAALPG